MEKHACEWKGKRRQAIVGISLGAALFSVLLHSISLPLFVLWVGIIGSVITWNLLRWKLDLDPQPLPYQHSQVTVDGPSLAQEVSDSSPLPCMICEVSGCHHQTKVTSAESLQPWINLTVPKKVDSALEDLLNHILEKFIFSWYRNLTEDEAALDELRSGIRFLVAQLLLRVKKVDLAEFITKKIVPTLVTHLVQHVHSHRKVGRHNADRIRLRRARVHRSLYNREDELAYLRQLAMSLFPYILPANVQHCRSLRLLLEEILAGAVLLPVADKLADPDIVNNLLITFLDAGPPPVNPDPRSERVEILSHFSTPDSPTPPFHCHDLGRILSNQILLMSFMDVMKRNGGLKFLQFFLTLEDFKRDLLSSDMDGSSLRQLQDEASHMYRVFCKPEASDHVDLGPELSDQFKCLAERGADGIRELRTQGDFLARAYDYLYNLMDTYYLPIFRHSSQYFTYLYGQRDARPDSLSRGGKGERRNFSMSSKLRGSFRGDKPGNGSPNGSSNNLMDLDTVSSSSTPDQLSLQDEEIADETIVCDLHDLSEWTVEILSISIQMDPSGHRSKTNFSFQVKVYKHDASNVTLTDKSHVGPRIRTGSSVYRTYSDFYNLEQKLRQFHGEKLSTQLPPKKMFSPKDIEYLDNVKPSFEAFLKNMLIMSDLKNSELLHSFLTVEDFSQITISEIRLENVFKSVPGRLVKEKGQNLKSFLRSFQSSTVAKAPRPDFAKVAKLESEKGDKRLSLILRHLHNPLYEKSHVRQPSNGVAVEPNNHLLTVNSHTANQTLPNTSKLTSIVECVNCIAEEVFAIPKTLHWILVTITMIGKNWIDALINWYIGNKLGQVLEEHRMEGLINLLRDNLFYGDGSIRSAEQRAERKHQALSDLKGLIPPGLVKVVGGDNLNMSLEEVFEVLQHPKLNKQLVYILLDVIICELFPELS